MGWSGDALENVYFGVMLLVAAALVWNGWRQGVVRQVMMLVALAGAYAVGWFGRKLAAPAFEFLGYPVQITEVIGGTFAGLLTFLVVRAFSNFTFKRTAQQAPGGVRTSYGVFGALIGALFAAVVFIAASDLLRLAGAIARSNVEAAAGRAPLRTDGVTQALAKLGTALNDGGSGAVFERVDPVPPNVYATVLKLSIMVSRPEAVERFQEFPGVASLAEHPKLHALLHDPEVGRLIDSKSYFKLLRNEKVVALANDQEFAEKVKQMDLDAALRHALTPPGG